VHFLVVVSDGKTERVYLDGKLVEVREG
jgi:hypothetical protein